MPELKELLNVAYTSEMHARATMFEHALNAIKALSYIENAAKLVDETGINNYEQFKIVLEDYKEFMPGLKKMTESEFWELIRFYKKSLTLQFDRKGDAKIVLYLAILFHDISKSINLAQHYSMAMPMARRVFVRLGFNEQDAELAAFLVGNHSIYHRLEGGSYSYDGLLNEINRVRGNNDIETILASLVMMVVGDVGGIVGGKYLTPEFLKSLAIMVGNADKNFAGKDEPKEYLPEGATKLVEHSKAVRRLAKQFDYHLSEDKEKDKRIELEKILSKISEEDKGFISFLETAVLHTKPTVYHFMSQSLINFYYFAYKYAQAAGIIGWTWVYLAFEKEITVEQAKKMNVILSKEKLWEDARLKGNPAVETVKDVASEFSLSLEPAAENPQQKIIVRINLEEPKEPKASIELAEAKYKKDSRKAFGRDYRRLTSGEEEVLKKAGITFDRNNIIVFSAKGKTNAIDNKFLGNFGKYITNNEIVIDLDNLVIWDRTAKKIYYTFINTVFETKVDEKLVTEFYYGNAEDNLDRLEAELPQLSDVKKHEAYAKLALVMMLLPQTKALLEKVFVLHKAGVFGFITKFEPSFGTYAKVLTAGQIMPVTWPKFERSVTAEEKKANLGRYLDKIVKESGIPYSFVETAEGNDSGLSCNEEQRRVDVYEPKISANYKKVYKDISVFDENSNESKRFLTWLTKLFNQTYALYPAILAGEIDRANIASEQEETLKAYLDAAVKSFGIDYELTRNRKGLPIAFYNKETNKVEIDLGLATVVDHLNVETSNAFKSLSMISSGMQRNIQEASGNGMFGKEAQDTLRTTLKNICRLWMYYPGMFMVWLV